MEHTDRDLIVELLAGSTAAAGTVQEWIRRAASPFRGRLGSECDDAVQDTMVELLHALRSGSFRGEGALRGYVWRITARNCLDRLRHHRRWLKVEVDESVLPPAVATALSDVLRIESRERLRQLVGRLPEHCRELWRQILTGRSYKEMSERMGVSEGALRVRVLRCRRQALELASQWSCNAEGLEAPSS